MTTLQIHHHTETYRKDKTLCRFNFPTPPSAQTKIKPKSNPIASKSFYETKRNPEEAWVNPYNPTILQAWQANMDIQFVGSVFAIALYVCSYVCKAELARLKKAAINKLKTNCGLSERKQISKLGTVILSIITRNKCSRSYISSYWASTDWVIKVNTLCECKTTKQTCTHLKTTASQVRHINTE